MKKKVLFKAPVLTFSGYGVHSRQVARYLIEKADRNEIELYIEATRWGNTPWALDESIFEGQMGNIKRFIRPLVDSHGNRMKFDVSMQLILPNEWTIEPGAFNIGMTAAVESDRANPEWVVACNRMDKIIVPSQHAKRALTAAGDVSTSIHVVPEAYIDALDDDIEQVEFGFDTKFNVLMVGQLTSNHQALDRKNLFGGIKAACEAFKNDADVGIVLKTNSGRGTKIDRKATYDKLKQLLQHVRKGPYPRVHLVHGDMRETEMAALYRDPTVKALFTLTRGEGFGLPILEAAVAGVPVIATDWSGHLDFLSRGKFIRVKQQLQPIPKEKVDCQEDKARNIWVEGSRWAEPSETGAVKALKKFRQSPEIPTGWAADLSSRLKEEYSYKSVCAKYDELLCGILGG